MQTPEEFVEDYLAHAGKYYDPAKAREYYLRTRKLKGRKAATAEATVGRHPPKAAPPPRRSGPQTAKQKQALATARVAAIQKRLDALKEVLAQLVEQAKKRSGVEPEKSKAAKKTADSKGSKEKPKTAQEKREAAKDAKERRAKEGATSPDAKIAAIQKEMAQVRDQIAKLREQMRRPAKKAAPPTSKPGSPKDQTPGTKPETALPGRQPSK